MLSGLDEKRNAMQEAINARLHKNNICPVGQHMAGVRNNRVSVFRSGSGRCWYIEANFDEPGARNFEHIALAAVESMP